MLRQRLDRFASALEILLSEGDRFQAATAAQTVKRKAPNASEALQPGPILRLEPAPAFQAGLGEHGSILPRARKRSGTINDSSYAWSAWQGAGHGRVPRPHRLGNDLRYRPAFLGVVQHARKGTVRIR